MIGELARLLCVSAGEGQAEDADYHLCGWYSAGRWYGLIRLARHPCLGRFPTSRLALSIRRTQLITHRIPELGRVVLAFEAICARFTL